MRKDEEECAETEKGMWEKCQGNMGQRRDRNGKKLQTVEEKKEKQRLLEDKGKGENE